MKTIKCLSIRQPWAWLIVAGHKSLENRSWDTRHRGQLLIHASARPDPDIDYLIAAIKDDTGIACPDRFPLGSIVGQSVLTAVVTRSDDYFFDGPYAFQLTDPLQFERPFPYKGQLGFYNVQWPQPVTKTAINYYTPKKIGQSQLMAAVKRILK